MILHATSLSNRHFFHAAAPEVWPAADDAAAELERVLKPVVIMSYDWLNWMEDPKLLTQERDAWNSCKRCHLFHLLIDREPGALMTKTLWINCNACTLIPFEHLLRNAEQWILAV